MVKSEDVKMKVALLTLGCKLNYAETSTYARAFAEAGNEIVPWREKADLYVVNTCSVTEISDSKSRNLIRKVHRINPSARIAVTGCSAQLRRDALERIEGVSRVFGAEEKQSLVPEMLGLQAKGEGTFFPAYSIGERTRSFLKVQDGCDNFCAYCTVPFARGRSRNQAICGIVREAEAIAATGVREIVLTGVNTGDFGRSTGESFLDLLKALNEVEGIGRYRISSIEPNLLTDEIIDWIASGSKVLPHFHIPLQVGTDELLKAMGRRYDTIFFKDKIESIRSALDSPGKALAFIGIDVMAGLPGESDELFERSYRFIESLRPAFIHVFPYSRRPGTRAFDLPGQVSAEVKEIRVKRLESLCTRLHDEFVQANRGLPEKVLFESRDRNGMMSGFTGNYIRIERAYDPALAGKIVDITI
ncbi:MAG: tRNA (N(6)-L-threonylcarbamoyladenosine(37)-C(2))-methylthiotransferase MtaB [Bacteroidales bacterium]|nr:tRNA (N(6)-L-threonylcarbamoyladenosine(37)-C(2))-methylthiotransferase MtaB [Bacteroidales bacterium]